MNFEQKIFHYKETKLNIPFRELNHTIVTVCELVKPICPNIKPLVYFEYFFTEIDFDKIVNTPSKAETLKYCNAIYFGLEQLFKADISKAILNYQNNISKLSKEQIQETQIKIIELIGNLKRQARSNEAGISFTQRYNLLYKSIEAKQKLFSIDYQILISHFNETIVNDLLSSFEIISDTFKEIIPLMQAVPIQPIETKTDKLKAKLGKYGFFELPKVKQLSEPNKQSLVELISTNDLPYSIAMIEYLGFIKHLKAEHFTTDYKLFQAVANWFEVADRAVKGNIYVLNEVSKENRERYTAYQQKQTVQKNYEALK